MKKNKSMNIYWAAWFLVTLTIGIMAGFLTSHSVMLGRFFTWLAENGHNEVFTDYFSVFRAETSANVHYNYFLYISLFAGIIYLIVCLIKRRSRIVALTAGMATFWVGGVFYATEFNNYEAAVMSATADAATIEKFISLNLPLHISFAVFYSLCFAVLLITGIVVRGKGKQNADNKG